MVRDADPRGGGPLRRGNPLPPEAPETVVPTPPIPDETARPSVIAPPPGNATASPAPATRAAASAARAVPAAPVIPPVPPRPHPQPVPDEAARPAPAAPTPPASSNPPVPQTMPTPPNPSVPQTMPTAIARVPSPTAAPNPAAPSPTTAPNPTSAQGASTAAQPAVHPASASAPFAGAPANPTPAPPASSPSSRRLQREQGVERPSFLQQERREEPARRGGRGFLNRVGFSLGPNARERAIREDEHAVSMHWPGPRTVAVVNGKGGAGKTPATVLLSAVFAQYGGAGVLAWDNNQTRGTLGWRTETGAHDRTLLELLPQTQRLLGAQGQSADLAHFVHHQPQEKYDVLRSKPIRLAHENRLSPADVDSIHAVAAKFYRLIIIDSGNDESDPMWLRMIDLADQIVVATTTRDDHAEAGALLLEALEDRDERSARLAQESVVVVSQADPKASPGDVADVIDGYRSLAREVVPIPFDREMVDGHLRLRALAEPTQQAWLSAAAAVARGF
ncbi:ATPase [Microbacterium sp. C5A9]|uniref:MinD/ParA family ATP-binding protein n=1 Tax=Microbacterium sp. C5A9 TaxID=2736663 RepID=UPI001F52969A|nr:AAA family ATPase [Microbacterium sp. C5A9]MCI1019356.1 ATPase [Microbacterium sp. C5A9]